MSISIRKSIRWLPDEAQEPTSTLVLTSCGRHYVDIRILKPLELTECVGTIPPRKLDWALAGTSSSTPLSPNASLCTWSHTIDSRSRNPESNSDTAHNLFDPNTRETVETGRMRDPRTDTVKEYEEIWTDPRVPPGSITTVLSWEAGEGGNCRGMVVRVGEWCQGVMRVGDDVTVERWHAGRMLVKIGEGEMPCAETFRNSANSANDSAGKKWKVGDEIICQGRTWRVLEYEYSK